MRLIDADALDYELGASDRDIYVRECLAEAPSVVVEPHWIPVTERLPEKSGRYFVTERIYHIDDKEHTGGFTLKTDFAEYSATEKKWRRARALVVVAWMDNEPYKEVTE